MSGKFPLGVRRSEVMDALNGMLGFHGHDVRVLNDVRSLTVDSEGVTLDVYVRNEQGNKVLSIVGPEKAGDDLQVLTQKVRIPFVE